MKFIDKFCLTPQVTFKEPNAVFYDNFLFSRALHKQYETNYFITDDSISYEGRSKIPTVITVRVLNADSKMYLKKIVSNNHKLSQTF